MFEPKAFYTLFHFSRFIRASGINIHLGGEPKDVFEMDITNTHNR